VDVTALLNPLARALQRLRAGPRLQRELLLAIGALLAGALLMPPLVWVAGRVALGNYANGGPLALVGDFMRGLAHGGLPYWIVAAAPYVVFVAVRALAATYSRVSRNS
jgi:hypothetical protein